VSDMNDYEDHEDKAVDEDEAKAAEKGSDDDAGGGVSDLELAEAETLTITAKQHIREQLEDEVARFLAQGGKITQVPPDESSN
jgi:hypothetical protein